MCTGIACDAKGGFRLSRIRMSGTGAAHLLADVLPTRDLVPAHRFHVGPDTLAQREDDRLLSCPAAAPIWGVQCCHGFVLGSEFFAVSRDAEI